MFLEYTNAKRADKYGVPKSRALRAVDQQDQPPESAQIAFHISQGSADESKQTLNRGGMGAYCIVQRKFDPIVNCMRYGLCGTHEQKNAGVESWRLYSSGQSNIPVSS